MTTYSTNRTTGATAVNYVYFAYVYVACKKSNFPVATAAVHASYHAGNVVGSVIGQILVDYVTDNLKVCALVQNTYNLLLSRSQFQTTMLFYACNKYFQRHMSPCCLGFSGSLLHFVDFYNSGSLLLLPPSQPTKCETALTCE